ncbi:hypothetical protein J4234_02095 [Candidatus Woesearchaeota archaeon]|nr:hypothetical protein [Candidatus Woesearchaeota archaeon]
MKQHQKNRKTESNFKIDEITLVFIVAIIAMIVVIYDKASIDYMEAEKITALILDDHDVSFANNGVIDENKMREIQTMDYDDFKDSVNAKNDFCVYIEDWNGDIILSKGSDKLNGDGIPCRE